MEQCRSDGIARQARTYQPEQTRQRPFRYKRLLIGILVIAVCSTIVSAALVNYLSGEIHTSVSVGTPLVLDDGDWTFNSNNIPAGSVRYLALIVDNKANAPVAATVDLAINYSIDNGNTWVPCNLSNGEVSVQWSYDNSTWYQGDVLSGILDGQYRFPRFSDQQSSDPHSKIIFQSGINGPNNQMSTYFKITFAPNIYPTQQFSFTAIIRPANWLHS